jgi:hypothetical protein
MAAPADIMSRKRSAIRPAKSVAVWCKTFFVKLYIALDKTQREKAAEVIRRYGHLISNRSDLTLLPEELRATRPLCSFAEAEHYRRDRNDRSRQKKTNLRMQT